MVQSRFSALWVSMAVWAAAAAGLVLWAPPKADGASEEKARHSQVEVVFVLDTTGSMGGLLEGAKQKIWSVANEIAKGKPTPKIKMGLIAYRDRGDAYVTKAFDLSSNLDQMYKDLLSFKADGGGDGPEHVLQALSDAVEKISWSKDPKVFKVVYLVGDAPPHLDYRDTSPLESLVQSAVRRGLVINTVQCGADHSTTETWQRIARLGEGRFLPIPQDGGVVAVPTPHDERIAALSSRLERSTLFFGRAREERVLALASAGAVMATAPEGARADRAAYKARSGYFEADDLVSAVERKEVDLEKVADEELPKDFRGLTPAQKKAKLEAVSKERTALQKELSELTAKRDAYVREELKKSKGGADSFDAKLIESLKKQAARKGILY